MAQDQRIQENTNQPFFLMIPPSRYTKSLPIDLALNKHRVNLALFLQIKRVFYALFPVLMQYYRFSFDFYSNSGYIVIYRCFLSDIRVQCSAQLVTTLGTPLLEKMNMKHLLTLTLVAVIGFAVVGCNKTSKVNASATAAQCDPANCDPANCDPSKCASMDKGAKKACDKMGTADCPMGKAKPAAAGTAKSCCSSKAKTKPAAAGACDPAKCGDMKDCDPAKCASMTKGAKMDCDKMGGKKDGKMPAGCPMSGK